MEILQTASFEKQVKKLHMNQKQALDMAIQIIMQNPRVGEMKKGDLAGIQVYKFRMINQLILLAYQWIEYLPSVILLDFGPHENFYRDFKH